MYRYHPFKLLQVRAKSAFANANEISSILRSKKTSLTLQKSTIIKYLQIRPLCTFIPNKEISKSNSSFTYLVIFMALTGVSISALYSWEKEEDDETINEAQLKMLNNDALKMVNLGTGDYSSAANKLTEAINLAYKFPSVAVNDLVVLYNNRSEMYEKNNQYEDSLSDIMVVLTIHPYHLKSRVRRARVYEIQSKIKEALSDLAVIMLIDRARGIAPSHEEKMEELVKKLAFQEASLLEQVRNSKTIELPSQSYCRSFLEDYCNLHLWKIKFDNQDRYELEKDIPTVVGGKFGEGETWSDMSALSNETIIKRFRKEYTLACYDLAKGSYHRGFEVASRAWKVLRSGSGTNSPSYVECSNSEEFKEVAAGLEDIAGVELLLRRNHLDALTAFKNSLHYKSLPQGVYVALKMACAYLELDEYEKACGVFDEILKSCQDPQHLQWVYAHRSSLWISRDGNGKFRPDALDNALRDLDRVMMLTEENSSIDSKYCRLLAIGKRINLISQTKIEMGMTSSPEDRQITKDMFSLAKVLFPRDMNVQVMEALLCLDGNVQDALDKCDFLIANAEDTNDGNPYMMKGITLRRKAMMKMLTAQDQQGIIEIQQLFSEVQSLFDKAIAMEPNGVEAMMLSAQLKNMMGDNQGSLSLIIQALPQARSKEEIQEILKLKFRVEAEISAMQEMQQGAKNR